MARTTVLVCLAFGCFVLLFGCQSQQVADNTLSCSQTDARWVMPDGEPVVRIYVERSRAYYEGVKIGSVVLAVWENGDVAWSANGMDAGQPYFYANVGESCVREMLTQMAIPAVQNDLIKRKSWFGPDSSCHVICVFVDGKTYRVASWHESFEKNPNLVATDHGIVSLKGRSREDVLALQSDDFQLFVDTWNRLRDAGLRVVSDEGVELTTIPADFERRVTGRDPVVISQPLPPPSF